MQYRTQPQAQLSGHRPRPVPSLISSLITTLVSQPAHKLQPRRDDGVPQILIRNNAPASYVS